MNTNRIFALFKREMKDIFRDKKTLVMMVVVPILLYPLLIVGMTLIMNAINVSQLDKIYQISFVDIEESHVMEIQAILDDKTQIDYELETIFSENPEQDLKNEKIHAYVTKTAKEGQELYEIHYLSASDDSYLAADTLMDALSLYREEIRKERVVENGLNEKEILYPITYELADASSKEESVGNYLGTLIPLLVITSICLGAIYPAIDVTAGERERGTLETLLTLPVTNFEMIMSKFFAVSIIASISAVLNICSMGVAFIFMFQFAGGIAGMELHVGTFVPAILFLLVVVIFFALFVTAVSMCTCIFAKSFKEANNYITPVLLVFMFGAYSAMLPDLELTSTTAAIPIINMTMMIKTLFSFEYNYALFGVVLISNVVYSVLTILVLAKLYNSESVLFSEGFSSIHLFTKRSEMKKGQIAGVGDTILLLCVVLLAMFYIGSMATIKWGIYGVAVQQLMILLIPLMYAVYLKCDMKKMFALKMPSIRILVGTVILFVGAFVFNILMSYGLSFVFTESAKNVEETFSMIYDAPFAVIVFSTAILPAIGEELLFRGFTFTTIRQKCKPVSTILIVSTIFGIYHMSLVKFFTTAFLGICLAVLVEKSGSILPGMLFHFLNNFIAAVISCYSQPLSKQFPILAKESFRGIEMAGMALIAVVLVTVGYYICNMKPKMTSGQ